jgi:hypothetical protein
VTELTLRRKVHLMGDGSVPDHVEESGNINGNYFISDDDQAPAHWRTQPVQSST